jgi:hypothetical protein
MDVTLIHPINRDSTRKHARSVVFDCQSLALD